MSNSHTSVTTPNAEEYYFGRLAEGVFVIPRCTVCGRHHFYPRVICPNCGSDALEWAAPSGNGIVYSTTVVRRSDGDYNVCLVDLDEGPRMMSRVVGVSPEQVHIGMRVTAQIEPCEAGALLVFVSEACRS